MSVFACLRNCRCVVRLRFVRLLRAYVYVFVWCSRVVSYDQGKEFADSIGIQFIETSGKQLHFRLFVVSSCAHGAMLLFC